MTFVYGEPRPELRYQMWNKIRHIAGHVNEPGVVMGDFNEALQQFEHFSATKRGERQMEDSWNVLQDCGLLDLGFKGLPWTYDNKRAGEQNVNVRLDVSCCNIGLVSYISRGYCSALNFTEIRPLSTSTITSVRGFTTK